MKSLGAIALAAVLGLNGCVMWRNKTLTHSGNDLVLNRSYKVFGLLLGPHTVEWGSGDAWEKTTIQLHGTRDYYTESEFEIVDWDGKPISYLQAKTGTITFDRRSHTVVIAIYIDRIATLRRIANHTRIPLRRLQDWQGNFIWEARD